MVKVKVIHPFFDKQEKIYREIEDQPFEVENERAAFLQGKGLVEPAGEEVKEGPEQELVEETQVEEEPKEPAQEETLAAEGEPAGEEVKEEPKAKGKGKSKK